MSFLGVVILSFGFRIFGQRRLMVRHAPEIFGAVFTASAFSMFATAAAASAIGLSPGQNPKHYLLTLITHGFCNPGILNCQICVLATEKELFSYLALELQIGKCFFSNGWMSSHFSGTFSVFFPVLPYMQEPDVLSLRNSPTTCPGFMHTRS